MAEKLAQVSLPKAQGPVDVVAIPEPSCSTILSCAMVFLLAHGAKSQLLCLPLAWGTSAACPMAPLVCADD